MSLRPEEIVAIAGELNRELAGGVVQKVYAPTTTRVYFEVRVPGRSVTMLLCSDAGAARISAVLERPQNPPTPPTWQSVLRRELTGAKLIDAEALPNRKTLLLHLTKDARYLTLVCERGVLAVVNGQARDVTARCIEEFVTANEQAGAVQRF